jgi:zinc transporter 1/2/3
MQCDEGSSITPEAKDFVAATLVSKKASLSDAILLILALCFHSVFEGIAIGVAGTKTHIITHKTTSIYMGYGWRASQ